MTVLYTQQEAAAILKFKNWRSLNKLIANGELECIKRFGRCGHKLFTQGQIEKYIKQCELNVG